MKSRSAIGERLRQDRVSETACPAKPASERASSACTPSRKLLSVRARGWDLRGNAAPPRRARTAVVQHLLGTSRRDRPASRLQRRTNRLRRWNAPGLEMGSEVTGFTGWPLPASVNSRHLMMQACSPGSAVEVALADRCLESRFMQGQRLPQSRHPVMPGKPSFFCRGNHYKAIGIWTQRAWRRPGGTGRPRT